MKKSILIILIIALLLTGCSSKKISSKNNGEKLIVYASFYPLYFLADEIGKENIDLNAVIPNGVEPHDYEPSIKQLKEIEKAHVFIYNGGNFETWADKLIETIITDKGEIINGSDEVSLKEINGTVDPHIWLDPNNMIKIAEKIKDVFISLDGKNKGVYLDNYNHLLNRLKKLDEDYTKVLKDKKRNSILVSHTAFGYIADRYEFEQIPVAGISPEQEPSPKVMANIIDIAKEDNFKYIFLETLANPKTVRVIADEANLEILILNPIEGLTEEEQKNGEDYISIMRKNLENLKKALVK